GEDDIRSKADQLVGEASEALVFPVRVTLLEGDAVPFDVAEISQSLREWREGRYLLAGLVRPNADPRKPRGLLCFGREGPRKRTERQRGNKPGQPDPHPCPIAEPVLVAFTR